MAGMMKFALVVGVLFQTLAGGTEDILIADFEGKDYGAWKVEGTAFGPGPARGTLPGQMEVTGFKGKGLVNSYYGGDQSVGTLTSPPFTIERDYLCFLIGGGGYKGQTCINLLVDGKIVRTATGPNTHPGGSERLSWHCWDVRDLKGKTAIIQIVDARRGGWGHINVDHIIQTNRKRQERPATRTILIQKAYLHLPVKNGAPKRRMKVALEDGKVIDEFTIELADAEPDFWVFLYVKPYIGKKVIITVDRLPEESRGLAAIRQDDQVPGADTLYKEKFRPQVHFSTRRGWNNDPNGLVYYKGEYHLFYQHNPYGRNWGNMHWGHAVSRDLVHWTELPIAIYPHRFGDWVFSGSAVVDEKNTAGFQTGREKVIVAAYTSTGRGECIAYSNDRGRTFTDYKGNPVVRHRGRDPKVIWYEPGNHWVMAVYDERDRTRGIAFYTSTDLKHWTYQSRIVGYYECPEIFELPVDGNPHNKKWVVYSGNGDYAIGSFDGKTFTPESGKRRFNYGNCFYASQTFNNIPPSDGRRIQIAWGTIGHPDMPFNQMMNFPVELTLRTTEEGIRMFANPVREIALLHKKSHIWKNLTVEPEGENPLANIRGELFHIKAEFQVGEAEEVGLEVRGVPVTWNARSNTLTCHGMKAPLKPVDGKIFLELIVDRLSIEIFGNRGRIYMPIGVILDPMNRKLGLIARGGPAHITLLEIYELRSCWER